MYAPHSRLVWPAIHQDNLAEQYAHRLLLKLLRQLLTCSRADDFVPLLQFWLSSKKTQVRHSMCCACRDHEQCHAAIVSGGQQLRMSLDLLQADEGYIGGQGSVGPGDHKGQTGKFEPRSTT